MNNRQETKYNKLIGRIDNNYYFLDDIFKYKDDFQGATGTILEPVSKEDYEERTSEEAKKEWARELWQLAVKDGNTELGLDEWVDYSDISDENIFDFSGYDLWEQLRELGLDEKNYPVFDCRGGGRCFEKNMQWDQVYNPELWEKIKAVEH